MRRDRDATVWRVLAALGIEDADLLPLGAGLASEAWRIGHSEPWFALRIARDWPDADASYEMEHALAARLAAAGARVPEPIKGDWQLDGWSGPAFSFMTGIDGAPLAPTEHARAAPVIAGFLRVLHGLPIEGFGGLRMTDGVLRGSAADPATGLQEWAQRPLWPLGGARLDEHPALVERPPLRALLEPWAGPVAAALVQAPAVPLHSDLHEENILDADGVLGFIDLGEALVGPAAWEFAAIGYFLGWPTADAITPAYLDEPPSAGIEQWRRDAALAGLCFGVFRWAQDRALHVDDDAHDEAFLRETLARLEPLGARP